MITPPVPADEFVSLPQSIGPAFMLAHHIAERRDKEIMGHLQPPLHEYAMVSLSCRAPWLVTDRQAEIMLPDSLSDREVPAGGPASLRCLPSGINREERVEALKPFGIGGIPVHHLTGQGMSTRERGRGIFRAYGTAAKAINRITE
jgi:hypothetical protein